MTSLSITTWKRVHNFYWNIVHVWQEHEFVDFFFESARITIVKKDYRDIYLPVDDDVDYLVDGPGREGVVSAQLFSSVIRNNSQSKVRSVRVQLRW